MIETQEIHTDFYEKSCIKAFPLPHEYVYAGLCNMESEWFKEMVTFFFSAESVT
jgi:hypothetical protein